MLTNTGQDKDIVLQPEEITLIDSEGNGYKCQNIRVGKEEMVNDFSWGKNTSSKLYQNIPTKVILTYNLTAPIKEISLCAIEMIEEKPNYGKFNITLKLLNIELTEEVK